MDRNGIADYDSLSGQLVKIWGDDLFVTRGSHCMSAHLIGDDKYDIGLSGWITFNMAWPSVCRLRRVTRGQQEGRQTEAADG